MAKKTDELTDEIVYGLATQVLMFDSWSIDNGIGGLDKEDRLLFTRYLLQFAGFEGVQSEIDIITLGMLTLNPDYKLDLNRQLREKTDFDSTVPTLVELLRLPRRFYTR
jgi:hypothetical protein